jgi:excisionase family DNA binding protein
MKEYSKKEAASIAGVNDMTIHRAIKSGKLPARKVPLPNGGEKNLITEADLQQWMTNRDGITNLPALTSQPDSALTQTDARLAILEQILINSVSNMGNKSLPGVTESPALDLRELAVKETLTLAEAARLSGCSEAHIRRGMDAGKIRHDHNGPRRALRLSRADVLKWAKEF